MITLVRSSVYFAYLCVSVVLYASALMIAWRILPFEARCRLANHWGRTNLTVLRLVCGLDYRMQGSERLPAGNCIIMSKHQSTWETIALRALLPPAQTWVLKQELLSVPFFGWALRVCEPIAIDRGAGRKAVRQVIDQGVAALRRGRWVVIFPEGTRVAPGERKKYGIGGAMLAEHAGFPVVPVAHNAGVFWKRRGLKKFAGTVDLVFGDPIPTEGRKASEILREVEAWIEARVEALPGGSAATPPMQTADS